MAMSDTQRERWAKTRQMGRSRYIWIAGVLGWGVTTAIFWAVLMSWMQGWDRLAYLLPLALVLFPIGGYFWGWFMWNRMERAYERSQG